MWCRRRSIKFTALTINFKEKNKSTKIRHDAKNSNSESYRKAKTIANLFWSKNNVSKQIVCQNEKVIIDTQTFHWTPPAALWYNAISYYRHICLFRLNVSSSIIFFCLVASSPYFLYDFIFICIQNETQYINNNQKWWWWRYGDRWKQQQQQTEREKERNESVAIKIK